MTYAEVEEEAAIELFSGNNVVLATPTGSGKSLVAMAAAMAALADDLVVPDEYAATPDISATNLPTAPHPPPPPSQASSGPRPMTSTLPPPPPATAHLVTPTRPDVPAPQGAGGRAPQR